jgi:ABC-type bacteriocin/lantibiotic exporter with double-glycine peptidase domain
VGAGRYANDCGAACVKMVLDYCNLQSETVDVLASQTALAQKDDGLTSAALRVLAARYNLALVVRNDLSIAEIKWQIDAGKPVIMLISYRYIRGRQNQGDFGGHFVVATGYDADHVIINDPDWWGSQTEKGHGFAVPVQEFGQAIQFSPAPYQGLVMA